jgi:hypothetical protein
VTKQPKKSQRYYFGRLKRDYIKYLIEQQYKQKHLMQKLFISLIDTPFRTLVKTYKVTNKIYIKLAQPKTVAQQPKFLELKKSQAKFCS